MEYNHKLALYVSYYLARFDKIAYNRLGLGNQTKTHQKIGEILSVKASSVKNWRDEFDPLFGHRAGWYQRQLSPSRVLVANALNDLEEDDVYVIVKKILQLPESNNSEIKSLTDIIDSSTEEKIGKFILRMPTGRSAEEFFINYFEKYKLPVNGSLIDTRDLGCGYDFEIHSNNEKFFIEVKGLSQHTGGILLTNKEWQIAKNKGDKYFIALVSNLNEIPVIKFIQNPFSILSPQENIVKTIQVNWSVSSNQLKSIF